MMGDMRERRAMEPARYFYRRELDAGETLAAIAAGVGLGLLTFYLGRVWLQRTPLLLPDEIQRASGATRVSRRESETGLPRA
ncbi:MAG: hypothetical protein ACREOJ_19640 [Gemmatimonadaceae bacterium]